MLDIVTLTRPEERNLKSSLKYNTISIGQCKGTFQGQQKISFPSCSVDLCTSVYPRALWCVHGSNQQRGTYCNRTTTEVVNNLFFYLQYWLTRGSAPLFQMDNNELQKELRTGIFLQPPG